ncbi:DNA-binding MarR family transcriptional regulator [Actinoplanes octamycinicus]|uniref:DNA-binding MarR family transcriptional regulator n=1 Tax=Actinoplanes octamycinicus TaxID=135948 RepID=A0A7W7GVM9_9ACTN|nr:MarR family transcriptional regulator [Actinoplanes octamycinicus]MBB4739160.1 DNA-binding MarR family transcriptional regulator [Actinoplanes octamycinicus]GIE58866.1 hypothetical protein Aoc01nite_42680 [Actinoplanes octamycinicus]
MTSGVPAADERGWADLADLVLALGQRVGARGHPGLTGPERAILRHLAHRAPATPSRIAAATGLQRANVSAALGRLQARGFIRRQADPADGRGVTVRLTGPGRAAHQLVRRECAGLLAAAAADDATGLDAALGLLGRLRDGL